MNHIYRVIFNSVLGVFQAVCERAKGQGKTSSINKSIKSALVLVTGMFIATLGTAAYAQSALTWGAQTDLQWDMVTQNWYDGGTDTVFQPGADVRFDDTAQQGSSQNNSIKIQTSGVNVYNITFAAGASSSMPYYFSGGGITAAGKLALENGTGLVDFSQQVGSNAFAGGVVFESGTLRISSAGQLGTTLDKLSFEGNVIDVQTGVGGRTLAELNTDLKNAITAYAAPPGAANQAALDSAQQNLETAIGNASYDGVNGNGTLASLRVEAGKQIDFKAADDSADQRLVLRNGKAAAIYLEEGAQLSIRDNVRTSSRASAVEVRENAFLSLGGADGSRFVFANNISKVGSTQTAYGGAIYNGGTLLISNALFSNNAALSVEGEGLGGGIINHEGGTLQVSSSSFEGNRASTASSNHSAGGGAVMNWSSNLWMKDTDFRGNVAEHTGSDKAYGGALYSSSAGGNYSAVLEKVNFIDNYASANSGDAYGGAVHSHLKETDGMMVMTDANFIGNHATSVSGSAYGGAVSVGGSTFQLRVSDGNHSLFSGNYTQQGTGEVSASSVHLWNFDSWVAGKSLFYVNTEGMGVLDMRDPMSGNAGYDDTGNLRTYDFINTIKKTGSGQWLLGGSNEFVSSTADSGTVFGVDEGMLYLYRAGEVRNVNAMDSVVKAGSIKIEGVNSSFSLGSAEKNTMLGAGGGNSIITDGTIILTAANAGYKTTLAFALDGATVNGGTPSASNAVLTLNAGSGLTINGSGESYVDLLSLNKAGGEYTLLYNSGSGDALNNGKVSAEVTLRGEAVAGTRAQGLSLTANSDSLTLNQTGVVSEVIQWTGSSGNQWNITDSNWKHVSGIPGISQFLDGDVVNFTADGAGDIDIKNGGVSAAGIYISGNENYSFNGGNLITNKNGSTILESSIYNASLGKLVLGQMATQGWIDMGMLFTATLDLTGSAKGSYGANRFTEGVSIYSGTLRVGSVSQLGTTLDKMLLGDEVSKVDTGIGGKTLVNLGEDFEIALKNYTENPTQATQAVLDGTLQNLETIRDNASHNGSGGNGTLATLRIEEGRHLELLAGAGSADQRLVIGVEHYLYPKDGAGAIYLETAAKLTISGNETYQSGAAIKVRPNSFLSLSGGDGSLFAFTNNKIDSTEGYGGAIDNEGGTLILSNAVFEGNSIQVSGSNFWNEGLGGAIANREGGKFYINKASFDKNTILGRGESIVGGGAIMNWASGAGALKSACLFIIDTVFTGNKVESTGSGIVYGGALYNSNAGGWVYANLEDVDFINNSVIAFSGNAYGGAVHNHYGDVEGLIVISNANFIGNSAVSASGRAHGGAISNNGLELQLLVSDGASSLFSGNYTQQAGGAAIANSIHLWNFEETGDNNTLTVRTEGNGVLDMRDPMSGDAGDKPIAIHKTGSGQWLLGGENVFLATTGEISFNVEEGILYLYRAGEVSNSNYVDASALVEAGRIRLDGSEASFSLGGGSRNAMLAASGGNSIVTDGKIILAAAEAGYQTTLGFALDGAVDNGGTASESNAVLVLNAGSGLTIDASNGEKLQVDLLNLNNSNGRYTLLYNSSGTGDEFSTANVDQSLTLRGEDVTQNERLRGVELIINDESLEVNQGNAAARGIAYWTNAARNSLWNITAENWRVDVGGEEYKKFADGDAVVFGNLGSHQNIQVGNGTGTFDVASMGVDSSYNYTFTGSAVGATGGLEKKGSGTLTLNNNFTGDAEILGGQLIVGGTAGSTARLTGDVQAGAGTTVGGHGQIAGMLTLNSGATLSPGNSIGTLVVGDMLFSSGSSMIVDAYSNGLADKLVASSVLGTGTVDIQSGVSLQVVAQGGVWQPSTTYVIIDADGGITGTFDHINTNLAFLTPQINVNGNQMELTLIRNQQSMGSLRATYNQTQSGAAVEQLGTGHEVYDNVVGMSTAQALSAFDNLSGEIHASIQSAALMNSRLSRAAVLNHLDGGFGLNQRIIDSGRGLWANLWGHDGYLKKDGDAEKLDNEGYGVMLGADLWVSGNSVAGLALGYESNDLKARGDRASSATADGVHVMAYGRTQAGMIDIKGGLGYTWLDNDTKRTVNVGQIYSHNKASYNGNLIQAFVEGSHSFALDEKGWLVPFAKLVLQRVEVDGFKEKGTSAILWSGKDSATQTLLTLGAKGEWQLSHKVLLHGLLGWQHIFGDDRPEVDVGYVGSALYNIRGVKNSTNSLMLGLGGSFDFTPKARLSIGYEGLLGNESRDHAGKLLLEVNF